MAQRQSPIGCPGCRRPSDGPIAARQRLASRAGTACALLLQVQLSRDPSALAALDSLLLNPTDRGWAAFGNLIAAREHERLGDIPGALAAVRRRVYGLGHFPPYVTYLREEGRLAALTGDRAGAARAYRHYLVLRSDPDSALRPQQDSVRAELAALLRETTDR